MTDITSCLLKSVIPSFLNMKFRIFTLSSLFFLCASALAAQTKEAKAQQTAPGGRFPEREVATYLDVHEAVRTVRNLKDVVKLDIFRLGKASGNFGKEIQGADQDFNSIKENYKTALDLYYRRDYLKASYTLKDTREMSQKLYKKYSDHFQKQLTELLRSCSESMVNQEMNSNAGSNVIGSDELLQNQFKLRIAYNQVYLADELTRDNRYDAAIDHLRIAKLYAINVLKNLETDQTKKDALDQKYRVDIIDAMGGSSGSVPTAGQTK